MSNSNQGYVVRYSHTAAVETFDSFESACDAIRAVFTDPVIDDFDGRGRARVWLDATAAENDDGSRAVASIALVEP